MPVMPAGARPRRDARCGAMSSTRATPAATMVSTPTNTLSVSKPRAGLVDHHADAGRGAVDFADHDADHAAPDGEPQPGEQERDRARQDDAAEQQPVAGAEASRDAEQPRVGGAHRGHGVDSDRQHREQKDDQHLGGKPGADPDDDQRQERDLRRGVERGEERLDRIGEAAIPAGGKAERNADRDRERNAEHEFQAAPAEIAPDLAGDEEHAKRRARDQRRRRDEDRLELPARRRGADAAAAAAPPTSRARSLPRTPGTARRRAAPRMARSCAQNTRNGARRAAATSCGRSDAPDASARTAAPAGRAARRRSARSR